MLTRFSGFVYTYRDAAVRGALVWSVIGVGTVFSAHHLFPSFRRQTFAIKSLIAVGFSVFGLCIASESALQRFEHSQRHGDNLVRTRAMRELGRQGIFANEAEIQRWREDLVQREINSRRGVQPDAPPTPPIENSESHAV